jgi:O-antigen biosynthesis protein
VSWPPSAWYIGWMPRLHSMLQVACAMSLPTASEYERANVDILADVVGENQRVLDIGCAYGRIAERLQTRGCQVVGVELDSEAVPSARQRCVDVIEGSIEHFAVQRRVEASGRYDVAVAADVIEHLTDGAAIVAWLRTILKPRGRLIASVPNVAFIGMRIRLLAGEFRYRPSGILCESHLRFYTVESVGQMMAGAGFTDVRVRGTSPVFGGRRLRAATMFAQGACDRLASVRPTLFGYQLLAEGRS